MLWEVGRGSNQKDPHVELNKKSQFINIYFLAVNVINMLHVNNNCTDILEKFFLETCFQVVGVAKEVLLM